MAISWIGMYLKSLLVPNAIQSYSMFVNPENEQQLPQPHLYQLFLWSPTSNRSSWGLRHEEASGCMPLRVSMVEVRLCSDTLVLGTGRVHPLVIIS